jgi:lysophospholipase L1-like esterase
MIFFLSLFGYLSIFCPISNGNLQAMQLNETPKSYLALGDSYTIGESVALAEAYPAQTVAVLHKEGIIFRSPEIIATTGWTTEDLQNALEHHHFSSSNYQIVTLLIGVNDQYQGKPLDEYKMRFTRLLEKSIQLAGNNPAHVVVLSVPDYSVTPFAMHSDTQSIAKQIDLFNATNKEISFSYHVNYLDVTDLSRKARTDSSLVARDGLHFSAKEYAFWADMLAPIIKENSK